MNDRPKQRPSLLARFSGDQIAVAGMVAALALLVAILLVSAFFR